MKRQESSNESYMRAWKQGRYDTLKMMLLLTKNLESKDKVINCIEQSFQTIKEKGGYDYE